MAIQSFDKGEIKRKSTKYQRRNLEKNFCSAQEHPRTHYNLWEESDMLAAIQIVQEKQLSVTASAKRYNVPRTTLQHYLNDGMKKVYNRLSLTLEEEEELVSLTLQNVQENEQNTYIKVAI